MGNFSTPIVISQKIQYNSSGFRPFGLSLALHLALFGSSVYFTPTSKPYQLDKPITISLKDYSLASGDINKIEQLNNSAKSVEKKHIEKITPVTSAPLAQKQINVDKMANVSPVWTQQHTPVVSAEATTPQASEPTSSPSDIISPTQNTTSNANNHKTYTQDEIDGAALGAIRAMIEKALVYPAMARRLKLEGIVDISFILNPNGSVKDVSVVNSSGSTLLDKKAVETVLALSGSYPKQKNTLKLSIPIAFELR